jgi:hypothetical protein
MITTIGGFISKVRKQYSDWESPQYIWFRGEPDVETRLLPKLYRPRSDGSLHNENKLLQMFRMKAQSFTSVSTPGRGNTDEWLFLAQHVGLPTRLLDWSESAILALYFALKEEKPVVWMLNPMELNNYVIRTLTGEDVIEPFDEFPLTWLRPDHSINIGHENIRGAWERDKKGLDLPVAVHPTYLHPRMSAQRSVFTVHGTKKRPLDELLPSDILVKVEIQPNARQAINRDLAILGIQEATAFPDLDGLAKELSSLY